MPDASTPLTEDNIAEALQAIKDARKRRIQLAKPQIEPS